MKFENKDTFELHNAFGMGEPKTAYAKYFIGDSFLNPLTDPKCGLFAANVTFAPGCRNNWHIHHAKAEEDNCLFAQQEKDGIRKKERMRSVCVKEAL